MSMSTKKRNWSLGALAALIATIALGAVSADRLKDAVIVGQGTATTKSITFDIGSGGANPAIRSTATGTLQFSNDGTNYLSIGAGGATGGGQTIVNEGFELGTASWASAGSGTFSVTSTAANVGFGSGAASFDAAANADTLTSTQQTIPSGLYGERCQAIFWYKGGDTLLKFQVIDGSSTVLAGGDLVAATTYTRGSIEFTCPTSGTMAVRLLASGDAAVVYLDQLYLGSTQKFTYDNAQGTPNQLVGGDFEDASVVGWATYADAAGVAPVDGTGGTASNITRAVRDTTTAQLIDGKGTGKLTHAAANAQGSGWSYDFSFKTKSSLVASLVSLNFDYYTDSGFADGDARVYLYDVTNAAVIAPAFVTCGGGTTPDLKKNTGSPCHAQLSWVSTTSTSYRLIFHVASTSTTAWNVWLDNLFIGSKRTAVGAAATEWVAYTPTTSSLGTGTSTTLTGKWRRFNDEMSVRIYHLVNAAGTGGVTLTYSIPIGYTIDTTKLNGAIGSGRDNLGSATTYRIVAAAQYDRQTNVYPASTTAVSVVKPLTNSGLLASDLVTTAELYLEFRVPIAEWAGGSAAASFGDNNVEYAYNTSGITTAGATDTTSFGYGPTGAAIGSIASTTAGSTTDMLVRFKTAIQPTDTLVLEVDQGTGGLRWQPANTSGSLSSFYYASTSSYGVGMTLSTSVATDVNVSFGNKGWIPSNFTYAGDGTTWSGLAAWRWRVKKFSSGTPVGFGLASSTMPGLVSREETGSMAYTNSTDFSVGQSITLYYAKSGSVVTLSLPLTVTGTSTTVNMVLINAANLPASITPARDAWCNATGQDSGVDTTVRVRIRPGVPDIEVSKGLSGSNFTASGTKVMYPFTCTYPLN